MDFQMKIPIILHIVYTFFAQIGVFVQLLTIFLPRLDISIKIHDTTR